jgi:hypothetical protein
VRLSAVISSAEHLPNPVRRTLDPGTSTPDTIPSSGVITGPLAQLAEQLTLNQ